MFSNAFKVINSDCIIDDIDKHFKVVAGPGAGKTYWLINHIRNVLKNSTKFNSVSKLACITYTNVAVEEIQKRLNLTGDRVEVSTIHSFLYNNIVKPYVHLLKDEHGKCIINYKEMDGHDDHIPSKGKIYRWKEENNLFRIVQDDKKLKRCLEDLDWVIGEGDLVLQPRNDYKRKVGRYSIKKEYFPSYKQLYWNEGTLHHEDVLYFSFKIMKRYPIIGEFIAAKYPYIFLDEFQDTSPIQTEIIKWFADKGSIIGVIGDPAQSIFMFQGASRKDFLEFDLPGQQNYKMESNRRSTKRIVDVLNHVRGNDSLKQEYFRDCEGNEACIIICDNITDTINKYNKERIRLELNGSSCMITQRNNSVTKLKTCSDNCIYTIWSDLDEADAERKRFLYTLLTAHEYAANSRYGIAIKEIIKIFKTDREGSLKEPFKSSPNTDKMINRFYAVSLLEYMINNHSTNMSKTLLVFYNDLNSFFTTIGLSLKKIGGRGAFKELAETLLVKNLVSSLNVKEVKANNIRTIHKAKGTEFQSILVYLDDDKDIGNIITPQIDGVDDICRLYYVALSRAEDFLCIAVNKITDEEKSELEKLKFRLL